MDATHVVHEATSTLVSGSVTILEVQNVCQHHNLSNRLQRAVECEMARSNYSIVSQSWSCIQTRFIYETHASSNPVLLITGRYLMHVKIRIRKTSMCYLGFEPL